MYALAAMGLSRCELSIVIVDDAAIRKLNRDYRGKDQPTDVLSFSQVETPGAPPPGLASIVDSPPETLGDVVISIDTALRQSRELGISLSGHLCALLIHGVLHLAGYDHERSAAEARRMFARERQVRAAVERRMRKAGAEPIEKRRRTPIRSRVR